MTITSTVISQLYQGTGSQVNFPIPFQFQDTAEIFVTLIDNSTSPATKTIQQLTSNYTLTGGTVAQPTMVTMNTAPTSPNQQLLVYRSTELTQEAVFANNLPFDAALGMSAWDKLTQICQELTATIAPASLGVPNGGEIPSGVSNGTNLIFTLANVPNTGTLQYFWDGILIRPGYEYNLVGNVVTLVVGGNSRLTSPPNAPQNWMWAIYEY